MPGPRVEVRIEVRVERGSQAHVGEHRRHDAGYRIACCRDSATATLGRSRRRELRTHAAARSGTASLMSAPVRRWTAWTNQDVFAWAALPPIPLHPVYGMTAGGRFRASTYAWFQSVTRGGASGSASGERLYPDELREQTDQRFIPE